VKYELRNENSKGSYWKSLHCRPVRRRKDNIKLDAKQIGCNSVECINVAAIKISAGLRKFVIITEGNHDICYVGNRR
jgi:hypothetical protein